MRQAAAQKIYALESRIAKAHWTRVQNRDAEKTYNRYDRAALAKLMPAFDWDAFLRGAQIPAEKVPAVIVTQPSYFEALGKIFARRAGRRLARLLPLQAAEHLRAGSAGEVRAAAVRVQRPHRVGHRGA